MATNNALNYKPTQYYVQAGSTNGNIQDLASLGSANQVLTSNGAGALPTFATFPGHYILTTFTANGTWTKDSRTKVVEVLIWGGGGGGGSGRVGFLNSAAGGGGGSAGGCVHMIIPVDFFDTSETVTVGGTANGGASQTTDATDGNNGTPGNLSSLGNLIALGGDNGDGGQSGSGTGGAAVNRYTFHTTAAGTAGGNGSTSFGIDVSPADSLFGMTATSGGGGGGSILSGVNNGGLGAGIDDYTGTTQVVARSTGGTSDGGTGSNGTSYATGSASKGWIGGGTGGGGGGGGYTVNNGGPGGDGGTPGGAGGGGGGAQDGKDSGAGGVGARGEVWVIEYI